MKENGKMIIKMEGEQNDTQMEVNMKDSLNKD